MAYLKKLPEGSNPRLILGQYAGAGKYSGMKDINKIQEKTGKWVGMLGIDYALMHAASTEANPLIIKYWDQGGLATISYHALNPQTHRFGSVKNRKVNLRDVITPGSKAHQNWMKDLNTVADGLDQLQQRGVVVLWRPFHEMNKDFFWWGNRNVGEFVELWRNTFNYLTKERGLNNLLWVYSPYQAPDTAKYYPGDNYVDIVAMDAYETSPEKIQGYGPLAAINKPFGFAEYGPSGKLLLFAPIIDKNVDYYGIVNTIRQRFPKTSFIHAWGGGWGFQDHRNIRELLNDPAVVTRDQVEWRAVCGK